ncbi:MAG: hypothetical protein H7249_16545 [Chitinophagaceae bacterium]|nr:hypothetical protein [Oligoflexus sp.]
MRRLSSVLFLGRLALTALSICVLSLSACKSTGRTSRLESVWFSNASLYYLVHFESGNFLINTCKATPSVAAALDSEKDFEKAKSLCAEKIYTVTPMSLKVALTQELTAGAPDDLVGTKKQRLDELSSQINSIKSGMQLLIDQSNSMPSANQASFKTLIADTQKQIDKTTAELKQLSAVQNDANALKQLDVNTTLSLQSEIAATAAQQAALFTGMLRATTLYAISSTRDNTFIRALSRFVPNCGLGYAVGDQPIRTIGIENIQYQCMENGTVKVVATTCALEGYERINEACVFTGKGLTLNNFVATQSGICGATPAGKLTCWGKPAVFPVTLSDGTNATAQVDATKIAASANQLCSIDPKNLVFRCWPDVSDVNTNTPFTQVMGGRNHFCGLTSTGSVKCWGNNEASQSSVPNGLGVIRTLSVAENASCAVDTANKLTCWGKFYNDNNESITVAAPSSITVLSSSVGIRHACAVRTDNTVQCWGYNDTLQTFVPQDLTNVSSVIAGRYESCAVTIAGVLRCWGSGKGVVGYKNAPSLSEVQKIVTSRNGANFCAVYGSQNKVSCWGATSFGGFYDITPPSDLSFIRDIVITTSGYACAVQNTGSVRCWGNTADALQALPSSINLSK